jgi:hypothetical protein
MGFRIEEASFNPRGHFYYALEPSLGGTRAVNIQIATNGKQEHERIPNPP